MSVPLATPVYRLGGWEGNVLDDHGVAWIVEGEEGWSSSPPVRPTRTDRSGSDGAWAGPGFYGARVINLKGRALAGDRRAMLAAKDRIKAAIGPRSLLDLHVQEEHLQRRARVRLSDQIELADQGARVFAWSMTVAAADPRRYAAQAVTQSTGLPGDAVIGRSYPRSFPQVYGDGTGWGGEIRFLNDGDYDTCPALIVIQGPVRDPQVAHAQSGRSLTFAMTLTAWESLEIDLLAGSALLNGTASRGGALTNQSAWFMLTPGLNTLQFRGQRVPGPEGIEPSMTVTAASAWT